MTNTLSRFGYGFLLAGVVVFCLAGNAYAAEVWNSTVPVDTIYATGNCTGTEQGVSNVCDYTYGFDNYDNVTGAINVEVVRTYVDCDPLDGASFDGYLTIYDRTAASVLATSDLTEIVCNNPAGNTTFEPAGTDYYFSSPFTVPSGNDIELIWSLDGTPENIQIGYPVAEGVGHYGFRMYDSPPTPAGAELSFIYPPGNYTGSDFSYWHLGFDNLNTSVIYRLNVNYSTPNEAVLYDWTDSITFTPGGNNGEVHVPKAHVLYIPTLASPTEWYVNAELENTFTGATATTTATYILNINQYATSSLPGTPPALPSSVNPHSGFGDTGTDPNATSSVWFVDCSSYQFIDTYFGAIPFFASSSMNAIVCGAKKTSFAVFGWLFVPPQWATDIFVSSIDMSNIFPFSLVRDIVDTTNDFALVTSVSTSSYASSVLEIPQIGLSTQLLSSSTLKDALVNPECDNSCANALVDNLFSAERAIIWIATGIAIVTMIF